MDRRRKIVVKERVKTVAGLFGKQDREVTFYDYFLLCRLGLSQIDLPRRRDEKRHNFIVLVVDSGDVFGAVGGYQTIEEARTASEEYAENTDRRTEIVDITE